MENEKAMCKKCLDAINKKIGDIKRQISLFALFLYAFYGKIKIQTKRGDTLSSKMGRPISDDPRHMRVETKMTVGEVEKLIFCCKETGKSRSEIVRDGIEKIYTELRTEKLK